MKSVNFEDIQQKLYERLKPSGWADKLKGFLLSSDMEKILVQLHKEKMEGKRFTPPVRTMLRAFEVCPYKELKVVMLGQDAYWQPEVADGLAFSCGNTMKVEASLRYIFKSLEETVYPDGYVWFPDLARWAEQGVLLINTALTTTVGKVGQHYMLWRPFLSYLFDVLNWNNSGMIYVYFGKKAQEWSKAVAENNHKFMVSHPASAAYINAERWECEDIWNKVNNVLYKYNGCKIQW